MSVSQLVDSKTHLVPGKLKVSELFFEVPLDYSNESKGSIRIFARSVIKHENPAIKPTEEETRKSSQKPWFVYLQGGPGFGCRPPQDSPITNVVLDKGYQMLYIDQRGTGLSNPISAGTLALQGDAQRQADYLKHFRADNIVRDCEAIRKILTADYPEELKKWSVFGQSFGGFCILTYLSFHHQGLREVFTSGGLAPVGHSADRVYRATFQKVIERNRAYYQKFPEDVAVVQGLAIHISAKNGLQMPSGGTLTVRMFLTMGIQFGFHGGLDLVHDIVLRMSSDLDQYSFITKPTLKAIEDVVR
ncbi:similar to prolyl oligopeptidase [Botrytis cinerea T4]|uniref:Similar to prolyl oligopeptidase n=1 Tax=Botryotinia fuckeliana (strain T4) TaxID=999810 RepID=G2YZD0_BOTF4|nr:similar to prolyl oligopeptidase [Botrytis cinerea T4]